MSWWRRVARWLVGELIGSDSPTVINGATATNVSGLTLRRNIPEWLSRDGLHEWYVERINLLREEIVETERYLAELPDKLNRLKAELSQTELDLKHYFDYLNYLQQDPKTK